MAFFILLVREREDAGCVTYRFGPNEATLGRLRLNKATGAVDELDQVPTTDAQDLFVRAAAKVRQHWRKQEYPNESVWAS